MAVAEAGSPSTSGSLTNVSSASWMHTPTGTPTYVRVSVGRAVLHASTTTASATYGGASMTSVIAATNNVGAVDYKAQIFELVAPASGAQTVALTFSAGGNYGCAGAMAYTGVSQSSPSSNTDLATGSSTSSSLTNPASANDLMTDAIAIEASTTTPAVTNGNVIFDDVGAAPHDYWGAGADITFAQSAQWSWGTSGAFAHVSAVINEATAPTTTTGIGRAR